MAPIFGGALHYETHILTNKVYDNVLFLSSGQLGRDFYVGGLEKHFFFSYSDIHFQNKAVYTTNN